jgi:hypothetical protein
MYKISFKNSVTQDLKGIDKKQITRILDKIEKDLAEKPDQFPELKGKFAGLRKFRVGDYNGEIMIQLDYALELITENCKTMPVIELPVHECLGYVCAEDLYSKLDMPPFDKSAMDGFAYKWAEGKQNILMTE